MKLTDIRSAVYYKLSGLNVCSGKVRPLVMYWHSLG